MRAEATASSDEVLELRDVQEATEEQRVPRAIELRANKIAEGSMCLPLPRLRWRG